MKKIRIPMFTCLLVLMAGIALATEEYDPVLQVFVGPNSKTLTTSDRGATLSSGQERLFGSEVTNDDLMDIDKTNANYTILGSLASPVVAGLAYHAPSGMLYATDTSSRNLVRINPFNGNTTVIGNTGIYLPHGAAIDPATGIMYVTEGSPGSLYTVNLNNAAATWVGSLGVAHIGALDFDPTTGVLYGAYAYSDTSGALYTINTSNGKATFVASTHRINGLSFDSTGNLYASENGLFAGTQSSLYSVDKTNGNWTLIGGLVVDNVLGLVFGSPALYVDVAQLSAGAGGVANFTLAADTGNANRNYLLLGSVSGTSPGINLPGGLEVLPLKWDLFTNIVIQLVNTATFVNFMSKLDGTGSAPATFVFPPGTGASGYTMYYAYALNKPFDFVSNPVSIPIVP